MALAVPKRLQGLGNTHERSKSQERNLATRLGGRTTNASGSKSEKGDVRVPKFARVECKNTKASSYSVTSKDIKVLEASTIATGEIPFMQIDLEVGPDGKAGCSFCVVPPMYLDIITELAQKFNELNK